MSADKMSYELLLKERDELAREATAAHAELYAVLKQSDYRSADELALDCMARMALEAQQNPSNEVPQDLEGMRVKMATAEEVIGGEGADAQKRSRSASEHFARVELSSLSRAPTDKRLPTPPSRSAASAACQLLSPRRGASWQDGAAPARGPAVRIRQAHPGHDAAAPGLLYSRYKFLEP